MYITLIRNSRLEVELINQRGPMFTGSGRKSSDLEKFTMSLSRKWRKERWSCG